jgi:hypothetical protein
MWLQLSAQLGASGKCDRATRDHLDLFAGAQVAPRAGDLGAYVKRPEIRQLDGFSLPQLSEQNFKKSINQLS